MQRAEIVDADDLNNAANRDCANAFSCAMDRTQRRTVVALSLVTAVVGVALGVFVAFLAMRGPSVAMDRLTRNSYREDEGVSETLLEEVDRQTLLKVNNGLFSIFAHH